MSRNPSDKPGWHPCWETNVYAQGRQLNRYPYDMVVSFVMKRFGKTADRSGIRIAELGFGAGNNLWFAAREGFSVAGVEGSESAVEYARGRFEEEGLRGDLQVGDFASLPWPDASIDFVLDRGSLTHARKATIVRALDEARRVLKPGGWIMSMMFSDLHCERPLGRHLGDSDYAEFSGGYFAELGTVHFTNRDEIRDLFGSRFEITSLIHDVESQEVGPSAGQRGLWWIEGRKSA